MKEQAVTADASSSSPTQNPTTLLKACIGAVRVLEVTCIQASRKHWRAESHPLEISYNFPYLAPHHTCFSRYPF
jgi:hypothetical protein